MNIIKRTIKNMAVVAFVAFLFTACKKDDPTTKFTSDPVGTQTSLKTGTLVNVDGPGTSGTLAIIEDADKNQFVKLNSDFKSGFATGTVVVYLAKTSESIKVQRDGGATATNVKAVGFVNSNGQHYLKLPSTYDGYSFVVLYCETAEINFGYAPLQ